MIKMRMYEGDKLIQEREVRGSVIMYGTYLEPSSKITEHTTSLTMTMYVIIKSEFKDTPEGPTLDVYVQKVHSETITNVQSNYR